MVQCLTASSSVSFFKAMKNVSNDFLGNIVLNMKHHAKIIYENAVKNYLIKQKMLDGSRKSIYNGI